MTHRRLSSVVTCLSLFKAVVSPLATRSVGDAGIEIDVVAMNESYFLRRTRILLGVSRGSQDVVLESQCVPMVRATM